MIDFEKITLRLEVSTRGGGIEVDLTSLGFPEVRMTAYQNYLGGGMLGRVASDCTISNFRDDEKLSEISEWLKEYYHNLTNHDDCWESSDYDNNQLRQVSAY